MSKATRPLQMRDAQGNVIAVTALDQKMVAYKENGTDIVYMCYARPGTSLSAAAWKIVKYTRDSNGTIVITEHADGDAEYDNTPDSSSAISISAASKASPCQITTATAHGLSNGDKIQITGVSGMTELNSDGYGSIVYTVTVVDSTKITIGVDSSGYTTYTSGGSVYKTTVYANSYS